MKTALMFVLGILFLVCLGWILFDNSDVVSNGEVDANGVVFLDEANEIQLTRKASLSLSNDFSIGTLVASNSECIVKIKLRVAGKLDDALKLRLTSKSCGCLDCPEELDLVDGANNKLHVTIAPGTTDRFVHTVLYTSSDGKVTLPISFSGRIFPQVFLVQLWDGVGHAHWQSVHTPSLVIDSQGKCSQQMGLAIAGMGGVEDLTTGTPGLTLAQGNESTLEIENHSFRVIPFTLVARPELPITASQIIDSFVHAKLADRQFSIPFQVVQHEEVEASPFDSIFLSEEKEYGSMDVALNSQEAFEIVSVDFDDKNLEISPSIDSAKSKTFTFRFVTPPRSANPLDGIKRTSVVFNLRHPKQKSKTVTAYYASGNSK